MPLAAQSLRIERDVPLASFTTFKVGGPAKYFCHASNEQQVRDAGAYARDRSLPLFVLGGGSNLLVSDAGWPGLVLKVALEGIAEADSEGKRLFSVGAGVEWDRLVAKSVERECAGMECLSGIPGTVGGTPVQNVGAYGQEVSETITRVRVLDLETGETREMSNAECGFAYRTSVFNTTARDRHIVLEVEFALTPGGAPVIAYADLKKAFRENASPSLAEVRDAVRRIRRSKAMLIVEGDEDCRSAGSFFKNPVIAREHFERLQSDAARAGKTLPSYPAGEKVKVPAAWLVEHAGFHRGYAMGAAGISSRHALALINRGGAKASDIVALKNAIQQRVSEVFGIVLQPEPVMVGF